MLSIEGSKIFKKWISKFKSPSSTTVKPIEVNNISAASFSADINDVNLNYCIVYWAIINERPVLSHFSLLPPIHVEDGINGEIRPVVITIDEYKELVKKYKNDISDLDDVVSEAIDHKQIDISIYIYDDNDKPYMKDINNKRLTITTLCLCYIFMTHFMKQWYPKKIVDIFDYESTYEHPSNNAVTTCQKLYPLSIQEDYNISKLNFGGWRDLIIANTVSIVKHHNIIPAVISVTSPYSRFRSSKDLFESKYILDKFKESENIEKKEQDADYYENNYKIMADVTLSYNFNFPQSKKPSKLDICNLFELLYTAWYIHHELKIVHTKLSLSESILCFQEPSDSTVNTYVIGPYGERDTYIFDTPSCKCEMYNFKSSIIITNSPLAFREKLAFDNSQLYYVINIIQEFIEVDLSPEDIKASLSSKDYWYDIFNVICVVDYIDICNFISKHTDSNTKELCDQIIKICFEYISYGLKCIINDHKRPDITFYSIWSQVRELFKPWHFSSWQMSKLNKKPIAHRYLYNELFDLYPNREYRI